MAETNSIKTFLHTYFPQISEPALIEEIQQHASIYEFKAGEIIMDFGSYVKMVPLVLEGSIKVMRQGNDGNELLLYFLNDGDTCSMSFTCCMTDKQSEIKTVAEEDTKLLGIPIKYVDEWMTRYKSWKNFVMLSYDNRLLEMVKTIDNMAFKNLDGRLWEYLKKKSLAIKNDVISTTHQEIAYDLNASREAISRLLKELEKIGHIQLGRNLIRIKTDLNL